MNAVLDIGAVFLFLCASIFCLVCLGALWVHPRIPKELEQNSGGCHDPIKRASEMGPVWGGRRGFSSDPVMLSFHCVSFNKQE